MCLCTFVRVRLESADRVVLCAAFTSSLISKVVRRFVHPPHGASWMNVEVKDCREATNTTDGTRCETLLYADPFL